MRAQITLLGSDVLCKSEAGEHRIPCTPPTLAEIVGWAKEYEAIVRAGDPGPLLALGLAMFAWLDVSSWASAWAGAPGDRFLEVAVDTAGTPWAEALLDVPWEALAHAGDFLAVDASQTFVVLRRIGRGPDGKAAEPSHRDLWVMFMAAAPAGVAELDFEAEEAAVLEATRALPVQVAVEESGCASFLKDRLALEGPFEAVHLSCHGHLDPKHGPVLALETPEGGLDWITPGEIAGALGEQKAPLVFLSACRTAEPGANSAQRSAESYVRALVRAGVSNVLGWDGSVYDHDAMDFARVFYRELAEHQSVPFAGAVARGELLRAHRADADSGRHWHLARIYAGPTGGGRLCAKGKPGRPRRKAGHVEFLDKAKQRVRVATAAEFVGRRRQAQRILRTFREDDKVGVLIHGMGSLGKSSLAARVASRMPRHETVVIFERYDPPAVFDRLVEALPGRERDRWRNDWRSQIEAKGAALGDAIEDMMDGPFRDHPILLVIDDLEQVLMKPGPGQEATPVGDAEGRPSLWRESLAAVLTAFDRARGDSRLLFTSRFAFTLPDGKGGDLAELLELLPLTPMAARERSKQWEAAQREAGSNLDAAAVAALLARILEIAGGNPGLQEILCRPILGGEHAVSESAVQAVEQWKRTGHVPQDENAAQEFFRRVSMEAYGAALTQQQARQLWAATVFSENLPVPVTALAAAGRAAGVAQPDAAIGRLLGLGLIDDWGPIGDLPHAAANPLARPLVIGEEDPIAVAGAAIEALAAAWQRKGGAFPADPRGLEAARLAIAAAAPAHILGPSALAAAHWLFSRRNDARAALEIAERALELMDRRGESPPSDLLGLAARCAGRLGEVRRQIALLERGVSLPGRSKVERARLQADLAAVTADREGPEHALEALRAAAIAFEETKDDHSRALTLSKIADILAHRGDIDEALRIWRDELLPVFERLGDEHSRTVTMGYIADVLAQRGDTNEALRIRREELLPVFERLADARERAITMGRIADILLQRGDTDEALRIRREEELPVYERLGDVRSRAVTMGEIADILQRRGDTNEALRIRREEQLPVYERLGDVRARAVTMGKIADILQQRGDTDEALRIRRTEELPVYERLGDVRSLAIAMGKMAQALTVTGETTEALRIHIDERLPVATRMGDLDSVAHIRYECARIRLERGGLQASEAQTIVDELAESFSIYRKLQRVDGVALSGWYLGQVLASGGLADEALDVLQDALAAAQKAELTELVTAIEGFQLRLLSGRDRNP